MKEKTKTIVKIIISLLIKLARLVKNKKLIVVIATMILVYSCVNGQMVVIKSPVSDLTIKADSTGRIELQIKNDSVKQ